jgi:hypothetical protein
MNILLKYLRPAIEFFLQYGWAILIIIIALVALKYLNVLSSSDVVESQCTFTKTFHCVGDPIINFVTGEVKIEVINNKENAIKMLSWSGGTKECSTQSGFVAQSLDDPEIHYSSDYILGPGERSIVKFTCGDSSGIKKDFDTEITLTYVNIETDIVERANGIIRKKMPY